MKKLPIGIQYFKNIRTDDNVYVDKTKYVYQLCVPSDRAYFLSRPRRFGKSLTLDTISEVFSGNKSLFEGLWIEDKWDWSQTYPVIRLSFDAIGHERGLGKALLEALQNIATSFDIVLEKKSASIAFQELIKKVAEKTGKSVVVLIDEYDKPIVDYIDPYNLEKRINNEIY
ncbi:MAG: AAA family ATPase [Saprospiraceae bacterium]|nr:AAA family ATPase [Saprospiraceae bacterium]